MKKISLYAAGLSLVTAFALPATALAAPDQCESVTWRVQSHWPTSSSSYEDSLIALKDDLAERTDGRLTLKPYPAGTLFSAKQTFDAVSRGTIQMGTISPGYAQNQMSLGGIASGLPFAWDDVWEAMYFYKQEGFEDMLRAQAAEHNIYWAPDKLYPTALVTTKPINSMADFKSLKIRSSGILQKFLTEAGASASYIPGGELYTALSSGVVDAAHWGAAQGALSMNLFEIAKNFVQPPVNISEDSFIINMDALNDLCAQDRDIVTTALDEHFWNRTNEYVYLEKLALAKAEKKYDVKVNQMPPEVVAKLTQVARDKTWTELADRGPKAAEAVDRAKDMLRKLGNLD